VEEVRHFWSILGLLCSSGIAFSQVVCTGTPKQCEEAHKETCYREKAEANLDLAGATHLQGVVRDQTGQWGIGGNYQVQLRNAASGQVLQHTSLDSEGRFALTNLSGGTFRLIVVRLVAGVAQRTGFEQPTKLRCENTEDCRLSVLLKLGPSDQPVDSCPPK
jgi:hypothetical protein